MTAEITKSALLPDTPDFLLRLSSIISLLVAALYGEELQRRALEPFPSAKHIVTLPWKIIILNTNRLEEREGWRTRGSVVTLRPAIKCQQSELFLDLDYAFNGISKHI